MLLPSLAIFFGTIALVWGADRFVIGASATASNLGITPLVIGLIVVGLGTSAPEILVGSTAAYLGDPGIAIGNALGSNIANIGLVLGITALATPLVVKSDILRREYPLLMLSTMAGAALLMDGALERWEGILMLGILGVLMFWIVQSALQQRTTNDPIEIEFEQEIPTDMSQAKATLWLIIGLTVLLISSRVLVWGAVEVALMFGISDLVIGLTIIAIGTSLPELAASVTSALKNEPDIAIGNVIGSNMFNTLAVLGIPGIIHPSALSPEVLTRDLPLMIGFTILLFFMANGSRGSGQINRVEGGALLAVFVAYQFTLFSGASSSL